MGIVSRLVHKAAGKAGDAVATMASLSPKQLDDIARQKAEYLAARPSVDDPAAEEQTKRLLAAAGVEIYNAYLPQISLLYVPVGREDEAFNAEYNIRSIDIQKWVSDSSERALDKLVNIYEALSGEDCNIALVFHRTSNGTDVHLAVVNNRNDPDNVIADSLESRLEGALRGNFPGAEWGGLQRGVPTYLEQNEGCSVACVSNIPTEKSERFASQTIEKLLDGLVPATTQDEYTLILLATPITDIEERKMRLGELYTALAPYASWTTGYTLHESQSQMSGASVGVNVGASAGSQVTTNEARTGTSGTTESIGRTDTDSSSVSSTFSQTNTNGSNESLTGTVGASFGPIDGSISSTGGSFQSEAYTQGGSSNVGRSIASSLGRAVASSIASTVGSSQGLNYGVNFGASFARSSNVTATIGKDESLAQSFTNYTVKHALSLLEEQMKRYEQSSALGMWDFAAYVIGRDCDVVSNVAHMYLALTQGEQSYLSSAAINVWRGDMGERSLSAGVICDALKILQHPVFGLAPDAVAQSPHYLTYPVTVTSTTPLTGKELAYSLNFPKRSVTGLPVLECAEFGRNIVTYDGEATDEKVLRIGNVFHMRHIERTAVELALNSLASHAFVTGSTGSGKSNTVYRILDIARRLGVKFLVVEPAKGEYKTVFGGLQDVAVYGTNPSAAPLLRINPFGFPDGIHVLEHLDRLVELFNVCWPMYAAMPAVLKEAIERSYKDCGWDLLESTNRYGDDIYPSFADVARNVRKIIESSEYDEENKGAYKGSLLTRLQSLTTGLNGLILTDNGLGDELLFDENVIVDLSRVGSSETRSLLMGLLVLRLQEHRMSRNVGMNSELKHLTVLEEAHNILRRTSVEQVTEGANLQGKSVEMLANAIAEMRTYGEGFIIVDQAPGLLDMAAIRNTNTKIIMRLADQGDRELVGRAANLNDEQIAELSRLPKGVAAVYQNEWVQPVLCKVDRAAAPESAFHYDPPKRINDENRKAAALKVADMLSNCTKINSEDELRDLRDLMNEAHLQASSQVVVMRLLANPSKQPRMTAIAPIMSELFPEVAEVAEASCDERPHEPSEWNRRVLEELERSYGIHEVTRAYCDIIQGVITDYLLNHLHDEARLREWANGGAK